MKQSFVRSPVPKSCAAQLVLQPFEDAKGTDYLPLPMQEISSPRIIFFVLTLQLPT